MIAIRPKERAINTKGHREEEELLLHLQLY